MINDTDQVIIKTGDPTDAITRASHKIDARMNAFYGENDQKYSKSKLRYWRHFITCLTSIQIDSTIFEELIELSEGVPSLTNQFANAIEWHILSLASHRRYAYISFARFVIFSLWTNDEIILPLDFNFKNSVSYKDRVSLGTEVIRFLIEFTPSYDDLSKYGKSIANRLNNHALGWITSTDWHRFEDISLDDANNLNSLMITRTKSIDHKSPPPSLSIFIPVILDKHADRIRFSEEDWQDLQKERAAEATLKSLTTRFGERVEYLHAGRGRIGFFVIPESIKDTAYEFTKSEIEIWNGLFHAFLDYRENVKGFEAPESFSIALRVLADYLSICLPQHRMETGTSEGKISVPKDFTRYPFIDQGPRKLPFPTFLEYCRARSKSADSQRKAMAAARDFFVWIEATYGGNEHAKIVGPNFKTPIVGKLDFPRVKKRTQTDKKPFGRRVLPHLLGWLYAIEKFGIHLQNKGYVLKNLGTYDELECEKFGLVPSYDFLGQKYEIKRAPVGLLRGAGSRKDGVQLTGLRMLMLSLENGLRVQTSQWLDRRSWDKLNEGEPDDREMYWLFLNTDKSHNEWETPILPRVRRLLQREQVYQNSLNIPWIAVRYENRKNSRFDDVELLFRNATNPKEQIYKDDKYERVWRHILFPFQRYALNSGLAIPLLCQYKKPKSPKVTLTTEGYQYVKLHEKVFHTPHSCRSTFITRRSDFIDLESIRDGVGQSSTAVTQHYVYPEYDDELSEKLKYADQQVAKAAPAEARIKGGPAYIKAADANSALRRSFTANRDETINRYKMISLSAYGNGESTKSGIELLRGSRANEIVFRDTHVCPVGEECPKEVISQAGEARRCGTCRYACRCIDHLPAIAAKRRALKARIAHNKKQYANAEKDPNRQDELNEIYDRIYADVQELHGWTVAEEFLNKKEEEGYDPTYFWTEEPEIVREHVQRVVKPSTLREQVLQRIVDAKEYPSLRTDELRLQAGRLIRRTLGANVSAFADFSEDADPDAELTTVAQAILARMRAERLTISDIAEQMKHQIESRAQQNLAAPPKAGG